MQSIGRDPIFIDRAEGAEIIDVDGNRYVDWVMSWGPLIHGHAHPAIVAAVQQAAGQGTTFGAPKIGRASCRERVQISGVAVSLKKKIVFQIIMLCSLLLCFVYL